ncbi:hypothetical protein CCP4SC76_7700002 [Gammaproteobacteria bacterium]
MGLIDEPDGTLCFGILAARALILAERLRACLAPEDQVVAIAMTKGWEQVVAALAVSKRVWRSCRWRWTSRMSGSPPSWSTPESGWS